MQQVCDCDNHVSRDNHTFNQTLNPKTHTWRERALPRFPHARPTTSGTQGLSSPLYFSMISLHAPSSASTSPAFSPACALAASISLILRAFFGGVIWQKGGREQASANSRCTGGSTGLSAWLCMQVCVQPAAHSWHRTPTQHTHQMCTHRMHLHRQTSLVQTPHGMQAYVHASFGACKHTCSMLAASLRSGSLGSYLD